ncbi:hypothetical protein E2C01_054684 [Portunus trituberculatus]|uniref:Uncharacterized protein n=1 Tax=Portunus trituberculatus TaxID=210409 RepID=A0A5B7GKJ3_PORTR|nr:hypothetical protein [Portunus trituberculatus]
MKHTFRRRQLSRTGPLLDPHLKPPPPAHLPRSAMLGGETRTNDHHGSFTLSSTTQHGTSTQILTNGVRTLMRSALSLTS